MRTGLSAAVLTNPSSPQNAAGEITHVQTRLAAGAENLPAADIDSETAMRLALQTRRDLVLISLSLAADTERNALTSLSCS
jgi:hypothetical protein